MVLCAGCLVDPVRSLSANRPWGLMEGAPRASSKAGLSGLLRLRGGAFWFSAVAGPEEKRAFWRTISTAPSYWIRDRLQRLCPWGAKEANIAAKELAALMEHSSSGDRLRGGGLTHGGPKPEVALSNQHADLVLDNRQPFAQAGDVCVVTGASGFMAGHIIRELTDKGFKVRGTVRNVSDTAKTQHLRELFPGIELYEADLLDDGAFEEVIKGARFVFHCASPFQYVVEDPQEDLVEPAVKGTMNVLRCARVVGGVRRVVVTSSTAAVCTFKPPSDALWQWSEDDWNMDTTLEDNPYRYSKTLAEQAGLTLSHPPRSTLSLQNDPRLRTCAPSILGSSTFLALRDPPIGGVRNPFVSQVLEVSEGVRDPPVVVFGMTPHPYF